MTFHYTKVKGAALVVALAALLAPATAVAGQPEAKQIAAYLSGGLPSGVTSAESGRAEAKQIAAYLGSVVKPRPSRPTPAESARAEARAFANSLQLTASGPRVIVDGPGGFDWADAAIGAGTAVGLLLLLGAGVAVSRQSHRRQIPST